MTSVFKKYYSLTKPGMIRGNLITTAAGFLLASRGHVTISLLIATLIGIAFVIASGCVFNNYFDRKIDAVMQRTKDRTLVHESFSKQAVLIYACILGSIGIAVLAFFTNFLAVSLALIGLVFYVILYGITKRKFVSGTIVGSIAGAVPIVVGYCAVSHAFNLEATMLFIILVLWQMPHFYSIALYRFDDYKAAHIPVMPVKKGIFHTKIYMLVYILLFIAALYSLQYFKILSFLYLIIAFLVSCIWLAISLVGFRYKDNNLRWARTMFFVSLIVLFVFSISISLGAVLKV